MAWSQPFHGDFPLRVTLPRGAHIRGDGGIGQLPQLWLCSAYSSAIAATRPGQEGRGAESSLQAPGGASLWREDAATLKAAAAAATAERGGALAVIRGVGDGAGLRVAIRAGASLETAAGDVERPSSPPLDITSVMTPEEVRLSRRSLVDSDDDQAANADDDVDMAPAEPPSKPPSPPPPTGFGGDAGYAAGGESATTTASVDDGAYASYAGDGGDVGDGGAGAAYSYAGDAAAGSDSAYTATGSDSAYASYAGDASSYAMDADGGDGSSGGAGASDYYGTAYGGNGDDGGSAAAAAAASAAASGSLTHQGDALPF